MPSSKRSNAQRGVALAGRRMGSSGEQQAGLDHLGERYVLQRRGVLQRRSVKLLSASNVIRTPVPAN